MSSSVEYQIRDAVLKIEKEVKEIKHMLTDMKKNKEEICDSCRKKLDVNRAVPGGILLCPECFFKLQRK
jgi:ribosomal protein L37AE/L43A